MRRRLRFRQATVLPGFGLTLGYTLLYLGLLVLIPLSALFFKTATMTWERFWATVTDPRVVASYQLTFGASLIGALVNAVFGFAVAWTLVRYHVPGRRVLDAIVDLPFALPTAVSGIALTALYAPGGWVGRWLEPLGIQAAFSPLGVTLALTFIGLPFVVRTLQPALEDLDAEVEEAAASLGAGRLSTFRRVILPAVAPALLTGFALALARALGEYGSVVFIAGNMPMRTEIASLLIVTKLEQYDYAGATAIAVVMLAASFVLLLGIAVTGEGTTAARVGMLFTREVLGGALFGLALGYVGYRMLAAVDNYEGEILITLAVVMAGYAVAVALRVSGPIAIVLAGMLIGNYGPREALPAPRRERVEIFWELIDEILNAVLFVMIGLELLRVEFDARYLWAAALAVPAVLLARMLSIALAALVPGLRADFPPRVIALLTWGGLRGGISVALALALPASPWRDALISVAYVVVVFSILVQGLTLARFLRGYQPWTQPNRP